MSPPLSRTAGRLATLCAPALLSLACEAPASVPVFEVERRPFTHAVRAEGELRAAESTKITVPPTVHSVVRLAWIADDGSAVRAGDTIAGFDRRGFEQELAEARADSTAAELETTRTRAESGVKLGGYERDSRVAELQLDHSRRYQKTDEVLFSRHEIVESEIDERLAEAKREHATGMQEIQQELTRTELDLLEIEKRKAGIEIDRARSALDSLEVRAPHDGILTLVRNWRGERPTVGAEMWRGQEIAEIPSLAAMQAEVFVLEADARGLEPGKRAEVVVEAHPEVAVEARIAELEAVAKPRSRGSPVQYFGVTLDLDRYDPAKMKPGQRVIARLYLQELDEALVVPRPAVHGSGEGSWVYRREGAGFAAAPVELGVSSAGMVQITAGLEAGDLVALVEPPGASPPREGSG